MLCKISNKDTKVIFISLLILELYVIYFLNLFGRIYVLI